LEYALDSTWIFTEEVKNPFNPKEVLNYQNEVLTTAPEDWNGLVRQQVNITIAEADARKLMTAALIDFAAESTIKDILDKYPPQIDIYISYVINPDWGVVYAMYYEKTVYLGGKINSKQVLNMEFEGGW
jgi:phenylpyruvate tautomerase PptA (4-oxalocrotonate tautomerase family)